ncbi:MAG: alpha/beta fold hydrolase [Planctomycetes bacterium]|nr:alpha/beta fold hydrolase [Planctomycetota bacterium]
MAATQTFDPALEARRAQNAAQGALSALRLLAGATPHDEVWRSGPVRLRAYAPQGPATRPPLLLVTPIINRYRIVDLAPDGLSLVQGLTAAGIPVYVADWGEPAAIDQGTDFEDYVLRYLPAMQRVIEARHTPGPVDVIGYCLGGTISVLYAARFPERVRALVTLNTPVDFATGEPHMDLLREWVDARWFPVERLTAAFGNMPGRLIQQGFLWPTPIGSALKFARAWPKFDDAEFAHFFSVLESWNQDAVDVPGAAYRRLITTLYRSNDLVERRFRLRERLVTLDAITCPVLAVTCAHDTICPPGAARALLEHVSTPADQRRELALSGGHIVPIVGKKAPQRLHPQLLEFLGVSGGLSEAPSPSQPSSSGSPPTGRRRA